jgi:hypothetical protein
MSEKKKDKVLTPEREKELEANAREREEALKPFTDNLPYDRDRVVNETKFYVNQSALGIMEAGRRLILLKAQEGHGGFGKALEEINLPERTARRFMVTASKFAGKTATLADLGKSKLYALLDVPDDELEEFEKTGLLYGADRDEIDAWGVKELKDHIRKQNKQFEKGKKQLEEKDKKIKALEDILRPKLYTDTDEEVMDTLKSAHLEFLKGFSEYSRALAKIDGASGLIQMEALTLITWLRNSIVAEKDALFDACPDVDFDAEEAEGDWRERIGGTGLNVVDAIKNQQSKRSGRA